MPLNATLIAWARAGVENSRPDTEKKKHKKGKQLFSIGARHPEGRGWESLLELFFLFFSFHFFCFLMNIFDILFA